MLGRGMIWGLLNRLDWYAHTDAVAAPRREAPARMMRLQSRRGSLMYFSQDSKTRQHTYQSTAEITNLSVSDPEHVDSNFRLPATVGDYCRPDLY